MLSRQRSNSHDKEDKYNQKRRGSDEKEEHGKRRSSLEKDENGKRRGSLEKEPKRRSSLEEKEGQKNGGNGNVKFEVPFQRPRSRSVPYIFFQREDMSLPAIPESKSLVKTKRRRSSDELGKSSEESLTRVYDLHQAMKISESGKDLKVASDGRNRSKSFSGVRPSMRRGSIAEHWGSVSEREKPQLR